MSVRSWLVPALCLLVVVALAAVFLFRVPVGNLLIFLLVLACPLSHLLLGHGAHGSAGRPEAEYNHTAHNHAAHDHAKHLHAPEAHQPEPVSPAALDGRRPDVELSQPKSL
ncbi:MAG TPA: hypothetical protein VNK95_00140 [Caldilineaceae bacterium]|nr:hypothetical protein [Caldilineaceae bacterium]